MSEQKNTGNDSPPPRWVLKLFTKINVIVYKLSGGRLMNKLAGMPILLVEMKGSKSGKKRTIPLVLPLLHINNLLIKRDTITKFLGILLDENLTWKSHISYITSKISISIGIIYKSRNFLKNTILTQ